MTKKIILWILVISWATVIFCFSSQVAEESDRVSISVGEKIVILMEKLEIVDIPASSDGESYIKKLAEDLNTLIRKGAHFTAFFILALLVIMLLMCYFDGKKVFLYSLIICLLYAISDEIHQYFVPGRACQFADVIIDFSGSVMGIILYNISNKIFIKRKSFSK